jgi:hypothetical protein
MGDSVQWGQGLADPDKFDVLVAAAVGGAAPATITRLAHSGAVIGKNPVTGNPANGEVPVSRPTIIEQCDNFNDSPGTVDLVLLNGGINDVDIRTILNPLVPSAILHNRTVSFCHDSMLALLQKVSAKFNQPSCRILVTGYYPILSNQSHFPSVLGLLGVHLIAPPPFMEENIVIQAVIDHCEQFFTQSTAALRQAVTDAGDARISFIDPGFTDANSVFAPNAFLWGLNDDPPDFSPQDEVVAERHAACDIAFNEIDIVHREQCYRASAGHPNQAGARQYASQILAAL